MNNERQNKYHVLARGIILSGEHLLVAHCIGMDNTFLPGGHVEFYEGIRNTLSREILEEIGLISEVKDYLGAVEASYGNDKTYHQEMNHLFICDIDGIHHEVSLESKEKHLEFYWIHVKSMEEHNLQPFPVRKIIKNYLNKIEGPHFGSTFERT